MTLPKNYLRLVGGLLLVLIGGVFLIPSLMVFLWLLWLLWLFLDQIINNSRTHIFSFSLLEEFLSTIRWLCFGVAGFVFVRKGISLIRSAWSGEPVKLIKRVKRGLHLTEFAIAMGIVGTLAVIIIIPSYCDYTEVMQVISGLNMTDEIRVGVEKFWKASGSLPDDNAAAGFAEGTHYQSNYVSSIEIKDGAIEITYGKKARPRLTGRKLSIYPILDQVGDLRWVCGFAHAPEHTSEIGTRKLAITDIEKRDLPYDCRESPTAQSSRPH